jgi:23S rRNA pseudouridine2605 synthase
MPDNSGFGISGELASDDGERLQKVLARTGWGSRRECEILIEDGRVKVNDEVAVLGRRVKTATDKVEVDGVTIGVAPGLVYYLLNKPVDVITTAKDTHGRQTVIELVPLEPRVFPVGRLDAETEGLLILTNDGELDDGITSPAEVGQLQPGVLRIVIHEGRNRQIRRMCDAVGHPVERLVRVRVGPLIDRTLAPGKWRHLTTAEVVSLNQATSN